MEIARRQEARILDGFSPPYFDPDFAPRSSDARPTTTLATLSDQYLAKVRLENKANGVASRTTTKSEVNVAYLLEAVGAGKVVSTIDYDTGQELRVTIDRTPSNRTKLYPGLSLAEQIDKAEKDGKPVMEYLTQVTYIAEFKKLMQFAVDKKILPANPALNLKPLAKDAVPRNKKRLPLTFNQINMFFSGEFYRSCAPSALEPYTKADRAWRFWLPLLMLFSGARPNELCQLYAEDVQQTEQGTWYLNLLDEDEDQSRKNEASKRRVPVHPELVKLGFLDFADERRAKVAKNGPRLFHELKPAKDNPTNFAWYPGKRFNEAFLRAEITLIRRKQVLYSFRHSVRDALRRIKASDEACFAIGGWTPADGMPVSADYGDIHNPDLWVEEVAGIAYPGLDLGHLYVKA